MDASISIGRKVSHYLSLIKFSHTVFALPFALVGFALGMRARAINPPHDPQQRIWYLFAMMLLCMIFARSAAMAFNRYLDRRFDALNPRTAQREIPAGVIPARQALLFTVLCCVGFVGTTFFINKLVFYLSFVALLVILFYSYTKRITPLCHLVLGAGLALAPIGAYLVLTEQFALLPLLFSFTVFTWVSGFDIIYALQDVDFDRSQKLNSIPAALGLKGALVVSTFLHVLSAVLVIYAGFYGHFHPLYWVGAVIFIALLTYQHLIIKPADLSRVNMAFANTNGLASILFAVFTITSLFLNR